MNFNTENVIHMEDMFSSCSQLEIIITKDSKIVKLMPGKCLRIIDNYSNF